MCVSVKHGGGGGVRLTSRVQLVVNSEFGLSHGFFILQVLVT